MVVEKILNQKIRKNIAQNVKSRQLIDSNFSGFRFWEGFLTIIDPKRVWFSMESTYYRPGETSQMFSIDITQV